MTDRIIANLTRFDERPGLFLKRENAPESKIIETAADEIYVKYELLKKTKKTKKTTKEDRNRKKPEINRVILIPKKTAVVFFLAERSPL